ncbi:CRISPR-associated endonuclease Cas3'' [Roseateles sp. DC23W]|uniref:CRISPR-associated endonuclease Cas3 n=1 Tax=Pelomonas dachongensis TaxID=3299029 RepID=A0ABW7ETU5_9BURK
MLIAHSQNDTGHWHGLTAHLDKVAALAAEFSSAWGDTLWAGLAGAWHDLGKARPGFQRHIRHNPDAHIESRVPGAEKTHSAAGALHARAEFGRLLDARSADGVARVLQYLIAGHHAGLADWQPQDGHGGLAPRLAEAAAQAEYEEALRGLAEAGETLQAAPDSAKLSAAARALLGQREPLARSLALRMLFSALVDADFLDTEKHFDDAKATRRADFPPLNEYADQLQAHLHALSERVQVSGQAGSPVMAARAEVQQACLASAAQPPGVFTLTVPTGGGKTLSSLAFALEHARHHDLRRVVYAIPYTSIIEQTASVLAGIFGEGRVIEHHSQAEAEPGNETTASRLACENWDSPLIVTTNVQLFESLFANRTSRCRKLHRLAGSVIVLDEAQMLPPEFLQPILDALNVLLTRYRISLVLCTATQPVLTDRSSIDPRRALRGLPQPKPIIPAPGRLFEQLRRTEIRWPEDLSTPTELPALAEHIQAEPCALAILNTRKDAIELARLLPRDSTLHLSAAMCGAHRAQVIADIRARLARRAAGADDTLHVISTQLIEAGVDVDFPVVWRALAGLDSIAQAAGRCNREGRLAGRLGQVRVVVRPIPRTLAQLRSAAETTVSLHAEGLPDALAPEAFERYFKLFYARQKSHDAYGIVDLLNETTGPMEFNFRSAADQFKLIDDEDQAALLIPLHRKLDGHAHLEPLITRLARGDTDRWLLRSVQRYVLNIRQRQLDELLKTRAVTALASGIHLLKDDNRYDARFGLLTSDNPLDALTLVQ